MKSFDVVVIGGGPGGLNAGMMLNIMGKSVALIQEEEDSFGGVCLNRGCMPTKSLLKAAKIYREAKQAGKYGLSLPVEPVDLGRLREVAETDLEQLRTMIQGMVSGGEVVTFRGKGTFNSAHEILIESKCDATEVVRGEQIIIATGSKSIELPFAPFDGQSILSSDQMLKNTELPERLLVVGGGALGCEFATLYHAFGSDVVLVESLETLLPREDQEAGNALQAAFEDQGIKVKTGTMIERVTLENGKAKVQYRGGNTTETFDKVLVATGRKPNIDGLNLQVAGVEAEQGAVKVNELMQTSVPHIYALGDATGGLMLAHAAENEAQVLAGNLVQGTSHSLDETDVPRVAFCHPEVAAVGITEARAGIKTFTMPQVPNGRTVVDKVAPAFVKLFVEEKTSRIAGAVIVGEAATEMIHEMALAVGNGLTLEQVGKTVHAHPTHSKNVVQAVHQFN